MKKLVERRHYGGWFATRTRIQPQEAEEKQLMDIAVNDQVMARRKVRNGNLIRYGSVVKLDGDKALVHFPTEYVKAVIPISQLEKTSTKFGNYARVQPSAVRRGFSTLSNWLIR
jgi:hypothetical protein